MDIPYRLVALRGSNGARLSEVSPRVTRAVLDKVKIEGACIPFLRHLLRQHAVEKGAQNVEAEVARLTQELKIVVGKPIPSIQKYVGGKWIPFECRRGRVYYTKIAVEGKEDKGKQLCHFNQGRESKVTNDSLREAEYVTPDLKALLAFLGHTSALGSPMPTLVKETAQGWIPLKDSARVGDNMSALAGTGAGSDTRWYLYIRGRDHPLAIQNARTLQERLDFARTRPPDARFSTDMMTLAEATEEMTRTFAEATEESERRGGHTREQHMTRSSPRTEQLSIPVGWVLSVGTVILWLQLGGAFLTNSGSFNTFNQIYHLLEYLASANMKLIAGEDSATFRTNLLQQLEAARDGQYYVKRRSQRSELCLGWKCWKVTFAALREGQDSTNSGEATLMDLICDDVVPFKEAIGTEKESAYFRLIVPEGAEPSHLVASERKIKEKNKGDHAVSNGRIVLPRLCSPSATATDYRFLHQVGEVTSTEQWTFNNEAELLPAVIPVLKAFLADVMSLPRGAAYLPEIDPEFDVVTDALIEKVKSWLDFPWHEIPKDARDQFLRRWKPCRKRKKRPRAT